MTSVSPADVHGTLAKHMLVDGYDLVLDLKRSQGSFLHDSRYGRRFLDFFSFFATNPIGINHLRMVEPSFRKKMGDVAIHNPSNSDVYTVEMAEFVETFSRLAIPKELPHLFVVAGGAVAVANALKAAMDWKVRKNLSRGLSEDRGTQVIHFREAFHGRTGYTVSLTNTADPRKTDFFAKFHWPRVVNPKITFPLQGENLHRVIELEKTSLAQIKQALVDHKDDIAALIIEPIQGEGGDNHFRKEFFHELRRLADENELMFILDEVQTGVGLTGKMWAYQHFDVVPDMICFGKKAQVCGFLAGPRIEEVANHVFEESARINSTWGGNLVDMVRSGRYLEIIEEESLLDNARDVGAHLLSRLQQLRDEFPHTVSNVRGRGLMCAFDLPDGEARDRFRQEAYKNHMLILGCGARSIRFRPTLTVTREECDQGIAITRRCLAALARR
ncbi:MAG: L-lysine 6-transaminase [Acidobacteriota bacterium]